MPSRFAWETPPLQGQPELHSETTSPQEPGKQFSRTLAQYVYPGVQSPHYKKKRTSPGAVISGSLPSKAGSRGQGCLDSSLATLARSIFFLFGPLHYSSSLKPFAQFST